MSPLFVYLYHRRDAFAGVRRKSSTTRLAAIEAVAFPLTVNLGFQMDRRMRRQRPPSVATAPPRGRRGSFYFVLSGAGVLCYKQTTTHTAHVVSDDAHATPDGAVHCVAAL